jgi:hypothetical protein
VPELDTGLNGVAMRAVRFKAQKSDTLRWFRAVFFAWVLWNTRQSKLAIDWEKASYIPLGRSPNESGGDSPVVHDYLLSQIVGSKEGRAKSRASWARRAWRGSTPRPKIAKARSASRLQSPRTAVSCF